MYSPNYTTKEGISTIIPTPTIINSITNLQNQPRTFTASIPQSWQYQLLSKYLEEDDKFVANPLKSILLDCQEFTLHNKFECCITLKQKENYFAKSSTQPNSLYSEISIYQFQPRVQLKYYHQAFRFLADFLDQFEEGINLYKKYLRENPDSIEGYDCLCDLIPSLQVELWNQFIIDNPNNRTGYLRLLNIQNEASVLKLFIKNNPNDLYGFEQLCLLDRDENQFDQYLLKFPDSLEAHNKNGKFNPHILSGYLDSLDIKEICKIIYLDIDNYKSQNQLIKGYDLEKLKYLLSSYICNQPIVEKLNLLNTIEQKKKLIVQNEIFNEIMNIIIPKIYDINQMEQLILQNPNDIKFYIDKANYYYKLNQLDLALKVFDDYINLYPCQFKGYDEKAQFMKYKCKPIQIKQHWEKFIQACPNEEQNILLRKAEILTTVLKQHDKAISLLDQHIKFYHGDENGYLAKVQNQLLSQVKLLHNQGRQKELLVTIDEYFQLNPQNEEIQLLKVQMLVKLYSNDIALQFIDSLPYQHSLKLVEMKAKILGEKKKEDGLKVLEEYQKCNSNCSKANKLRIQFIRDFFGNSYIQCLRELIKNDPDSIKGYKLFYKLTLDEHTLYDEARDWIDFYIETHPDQKENHKILLNMLTKMRCDNLNQG